MVSKKYLIKKFTDISLKEVLLISEKAKGYDTSIFLESEGREVNLKSVLELHHLELRPNSEIVLKVSGNNPFQVLDEFGDIFEKVI